jgi:hypothetical protein
VRVQHYNRTHSNPEAFASFGQGTLTVDFEKLTEVFNMLVEARREFAIMHDTSHQMLEESARISAEACRMRLDLMRRLDALERPKWYRRLWDWYVNKAGGWVHG